MKTTFKEVFRELDDEMTNIEINSEYTPDIDVEKIKGEVFMRINDNNKSGKKTLGKSFFVILAAAVLSAAMITAGAMGSFNEAFGSFIIGESPDGIYTGDDLEISSKNNNIEFMGITGDKNTAMVSMKLTNPDGSPFIEESDLSNTWIAAPGKDELVDNTIYGEIDGEISYSTPRWYKLKTGKSEYDFADVMSTFGLYFEDANAINVYIFSESRVGALMGETMTASLDAASAYTIKEVLYDFSEHYEDNLTEDGDGFYMLHRQRALEEFIDEYGLEAKDGVRLMVNPETWDIVLAKETPLNIDLNLSVKMNYRSSEVKLGKADLTQCDTEYRVQSGKLSATTYSIMLKPSDVTPENAESKTPIEKYFIYDGSSYCPDKLTVSLEDGTTQTAYDQGYAHFYFDTETERYQFYASSETGRMFPAAVDPNKIVSVSVDGVVIWERK